LVVPTDIKVTVLYWTDPWWPASPGGIDTYIRSFLRYAPSDFAIEVIGVTADPRARPVGRWLELPIGNRIVRFLALFAPATLSRTRLPLSLRYCARLALRRARIDADVVIAHRLEPLLCIRRAKAAVLVHHTGPSDIPTAAKTDLRWAKAPRVHLWLESLAVRRVRRIHAVTRHALDHFRSRHGAAAGQARFFPTFFDPEVFYVPARDVRERAREALRTRLGLPNDACIAVSVGRLDHGKDFFLTIAAFQLLRARHERSFLLIVGTGPLREEIRAHITAARMHDRILLLGQRSPEEIAAVHHGSDLFVLTSAYEGMSIALLEAQASGLPVVVPDVGEVRLTLRPGVGIIAPRTPRGICEAVSECIAGAGRFVPQDAADAVAEYSAANVIPAICGDLRELL
jgi:glycosyltransferase involved in cell wall biosynthesis